MPWDCRFEVLTGKPSGETAKILTEIYESSFPPWEREPATAVFDGASGHTLLCAYIGDQIVGFGDVFSLGERDGLLRYLAVSEEHRSLGIGRRILDHIAERFAGLEYLLLEAESPANAPDASLAARRIGFYERWGAREI